MLRSLLIALALASVGTAAFAHDHDGGDRGWRGERGWRGDRGGGYYQGYGGYGHRHSPPGRYYMPPPRVYYAPPRYYVSPPPVYYAPQYYPAPSYGYGYQPSLGIQLYIPLR